MDTMTGIYIRQSNRHNWSLVGLADSKSELIRQIYLASQGFSNFQIGICENSNTGIIMDYDNKPANHPMRLVPHIDLGMAELLVRFIKSNEMPISPDVFARAKELGLLEVGYRIYLI